MSIYFMNTDAGSLGGASPHDQWFEQGMAFSGGPRKYGEKLGLLWPGDICLMWANGIGIVGVGRVLQPWDGRTYSDPLVYRSPHYFDEYRVKVDWFKDFRSYPISCAAFKKRFRWNPRGTLLRARRDERAIEDFVKMHGAGR